MKKVLALFLTLLALVAKAQTLDISGVYEAGLHSPPSPMYLALDCDSTYHVIIRYDAGARKSIYPPLSSKWKWHFDETSTEVLLDSPVYRIGMLHLTDTGTLISKARRQRITWVKVISYDNACQARIYVNYEDFSARTVYTMVPGLQILKKEKFENSQVVERWTYHRLSIVQMKSRGLDSLKNAYVGKDDYKGSPTYRVAMQIMLSELKDWPVERYEKSTDHGWEINTYDVDGKLIAQETKSSPQN